MTKILCAKCGALVDEEQLAKHLGTHLEAEERLAKQQRAASLLIAALVKRFGGSVTLLASDLRVDGQLVREDLSGGGVRFRVVKTT